MARAIGVSLLVIAIFLTGISPFTNINHNNDNCCQLDSSYVIDNIQQDYIGIHKIDDYTLTSTLGTYLFQSAFFIRESTAVAFRLIIAEGFVDIQANGASYRIFTAEFADNTVIISQYDKIFTLTIGGHAETFIADGDIINLTISYSLKAFKLTSLTNDTVEHVNTKQGDNYNTNIVGAAGLIGIGVLNGNDYAVENLLCGEYYSIVLLQNYDLFFFSFFIISTIQFNYKTEDCVIPLPNFFYALKLETIELPVGASVTLDKHIVLSHYGKYIFKLSNEYEYYFYTIEYIKAEEPPIVPPDEDEPTDEEPPIVPPDEDEPTDEEPPDENPPEEEPPLIVPPEEYPPPNEQLYHRTTDWLKVVLVICGALIVLGAVIVSFVMLNKKKKK